MCLLAVNVGGLDAATKLPGFPTDNYLNFAIAIPFMQGALFASINAGSSLARDVETGFLKRLALTPMQRSALLLGNLAGVMTVAALASLVYLVVGLAAGLHLDAGLGGGLVLIVLAFLVALAFASLGAWVGLRAGSGEAVQGLFPVFFVFLFLSSQALPRPLIEQDWFRTIATWNPVSYMLEGIRSVVITGWDRVALERGFAIAIVLCAIGIFGASRAAADEAGADMRRFASVARAVAWRQIHNFTHNPAFLLPSIIFPLFFFTAFAGGLSNVSNAPGLRLPVRLHGVPVRVRAAAVRRVRRRLHRLRRRRRLRARLRAPADARGAQPAGDPRRLPGSRASCAR